MTQSLSGLLNKAADIVERRGGSAGLDFALRELLQNLQELRERKSEGEKVLDEFFSVYK